MSWSPRFTISPALLTLVEEVTALRERILGASVEVSWMPALRKDTRTRSAHASTAIEGNPLTLEQVRAVEEGREPEAAEGRSKREVLNYFAGLRFIAKNAGLRKVTHDEVLALHRILAKDVMDQGVAGKYRTVAVRVGKYVPPPPAQVSGLVHELLEWWNGASRALSPILTSAVIHYRFEAIHPFADGNGRTGRALALWELYRRGFDTHHIFAVDEFYWEDRKRYYRELDAVRVAGDDLSGWLEYCALGLRQTLERAWQRMTSLRSAAGGKLVLRPRQERLLALLRDHQSMAPAEIWRALKVSRQGAMDLLRPLLEAGVVEKVGTKKTGRYRLKRL